jgi:hypothetical protein
MCCTVPFDFVPDLVDDGWNELRGGVGPWSLSVSVKTNDHCFKEHRKSFPTPRARRLIIGGIRKEVYKGGRFNSLVFFLFWYFIWGGEVQKGEIGGTLFSKAAINSCQFGFRTAYTRLNCSGGGRFCLINRPEAQQSAEMSREHGRQERTLQNLTISSEFYAPMLWDEEQPSTGCV